MLRPSVGSDVEHRTRRTAIYQLEIKPKRLLVLNFPNEAKYTLSSNRRSRLSRRESSNVRSWIGSSYEKIDVCRPRLKSFVPH